MTRPPLNDKNIEQGLIDLGPIPGEAPVAVFNLAGIENLLQTKGFRAWHYQHALLPDVDVLGGPENPLTTAASLRGVMYYSVRELRIVPQQFKLEDRLTVQGLYGVGSAMFNVTGNYTDGDKGQAHVAKRDLLVFPDLTDKARQRVQWNPTGPMRLNYKIKGIDLLFDSTTYYTQGVDYEIVDGKIAWLAKGRKPKITDGKPAVLSCVYWFTPIYIVENLPHSIRVIPSNDFGHAAFPREMTYAPQLVVAKPSTLFEEDNPLDWAALPPYPEYPDSANTTGGSR
jgi:hypothetical protein